ncbi:MAG: hypothetical protein R2750_14665 [Bacteroidales bacterium]
MKRINQIVALATLSAIFFVFSCSKEEEKSESQQQVVRTAYEQQVTQAIKDFEQKVAHYSENPGYKSGETVSADSALWLLEATINYSHAFPNEFYEELLAEELTLVIPKNEDGEVDMQVLTQKYDEMRGDITTLFYNSSFENKGLILVDLTDISQTGDEMTLGLEIIIGDRGGTEPPPVGSGPFGEVDDWWYGEDYGYCDDHSVFDDAANRLWNEAKELVPDPNGNYYFINEFTFTISGGQPFFQRDETPDNLLDYYLYYSIEGEQGIPFVEQETLCVEYAEMNAYYTYLNALMFDVLPNDYLPDVYDKYGYSVESFNNLEDIKMNIPPKTKYYHEAEFTFGIKVGYMDGEGPQEL